MGSLPLDTIDRKVRKMKMIAPSGKEVDIGQTLKPDEYIGMTRREVLDGYLRNRAEELGANVINGLVTAIEETPEGQYKLEYSAFNAKKDGATADKDTLEVDLIVGADGANS